MPPARKKAPIMRQQNCMKSRQKFRIYVKNVLTSQFNCEMLHVA